MEVLTFIDDFVSTPLIVLDDGRFIRSIDVKVIFAFVQAQVKAEAIRALHAAEVMRIQAEADAAKVIRILVEGDDDNCIVNVMICMQVSMICLFAETQSGCGGEGMCS